MAAPYKITVYVNGEQISKLYDKERCMVTNIGDKPGADRGGHAAEGRQRDNRDVPS